jgi:hypothetical protein
MYKIKYGKNKTGTIIRVLLFVMFFTAGAFASLLAERLCIANGVGFEAERQVSTQEETQDTIERETVIEEKNTPEMREVWIDGIDISNYISEGDLIDVRIVDPNGGDSKLLAEKCIKGMDKEGVFLLVREDELACITDALIGMKEGSIVRAYAVRIP